MTRGSEYFCWIEWRDLRNNPFSEIHSVTRFIFKVTKISSQLHSKFILSAIPVAKKAGLYFPNFSEWRLTDWSTTEFILLLCFADIWNPINTVKHWLRVPHWWKSLIWVQIVILNSNGVTCAVRKCNEYHSIFNWNCLCWDSVSLYISFTSGEFSDIATNATYLAYACPPNCGHSWSAGYSWKPDDWSKNFQKYSAFSSPDALRVNTTPESKGDLPTLYSQSLFSYMVSSSNYNVVWKIDRILPILIELTKVVTDGTKTFDTHRRLTVSFHFQGRLTHALCSRKFCRPLIGAKL